MQISGTEGAVICSLLSELEMLYWFPYSLQTEIEKDKMTQEWERIKYMT